MFYFIVRSQIFIAVAAVALSIETQVQVGLSPKLEPYLLSIFFATLLAYNLHSWAISLRISESKKEDHQHLEKKATKTLTVLLMVSIIGFSISCLLLKQQICITLLPIAFITFFYSVPIARINNRAFTLRDIPLIKTFLIAGVWTATTILVPLIQSEQPFSELQIYPLLIERFLFVFSIAIQFDIRDMHADKGSGIKTLPLLIGKKNALKLSVAALIIFIVMSIVQYTNLKMYYLIPAFLISAIVTLILIVNKKIREAKYFHSYFLDGSLLLQGILVCLFYNLN